MKMSELINKLEKDMELFGDIEVGVDYRDEGGSCGGYDSEVECYYDIKNNFILCKEGKYEVDRID